MTEFMEKCKIIDSSLALGKPPKKWQESYPGATWELVTPDNYLDFAG